MRPDDNSGGLKSLIATKGPLWGRMGLEGHDFVVE